MEDDDGVRALGSGSEDDLGTVAGQIKVATLGSLASQSFAEHKGDFGLGRQARDEGYIGVVQNGFDCGLVLQSTHGDGGKRVDEVVGYRVSRAKAERERVDGPAIPKVSRRSMVPGIFSHDQHSARLLQRQTTSILEKDGALLADSADQIDGAAFLHVPILVHSGYQIIGANFLGRGRERVVLLAEREVRRQDPDGLILNPTLVDGTVADKCEQLVAKEFPKESTEAIARGRNIETALGERLSAPNS